MFENVYIWKRLAIGFGVVILFTLVVGGVGISNMGKLAGLTHDLYEKPYKVSNAMRDLGMQIFAEQKSMLAIVLASSPDEIKTAMQALKQHTIAANSDFDLIEKSDILSFEQLQRINTKYKEWQTLSTEIIKLKLDGKQDQALELLEGDAEITITHTGLLIADLINVVNGVGDEFIVEARSTFNETYQEMLLLLLITVLGGLAISFYISRSITSPLYAIVNVMKQIALGNLQRELDMDRRDEIGILASSFHKITKNLQHKALIADQITEGDLDHLVDLQSDHDQLAFAMNKMILSLRENIKENADQTWLMSGQAELALTMRGDQSLDGLAQNTIDFLANFLSCQIGSLYLVDESKTQLNLQAGYAYDHQSTKSQGVVFGDGLVGQAAKQKELIVVDDLPDDYLKVRSSLGHCKLNHVVIIPIVLNSEVVGVMELGSMAKLTDLQLEYLTTIVENVAIALNSALSRLVMRGLLDESNRQSVLLQTQQNELRAANEDLEEQTNKLLLSEERLKIQQEELQATNEELEEQTATLKSSESRLQLQQEQLQASNEEMELKTQALQEQNIKIEQYSRDVTGKAQELEQASRYKSEFLANMSHELRTPLNSLLLLSRILSENGDGNLTEDQIESATIIYNSGNDLLSLINDILDLSKIEAGQMTVDLSEIRLDEFATRINNTFSHIVADKGLGFKIDFASDLPEFIIGDMKRVDQVVKNLVSNAIKFTAEGQVGLHAYTSMNEAGRQMLNIAISDTGIGIPGAKQSLIFEAFQQADGGTSRQYGGTGLGLSISRQLAKLMEGEITLTSEVGKGSTFVLAIPFNLTAKSEGATSAELIRTTYETTQYLPPRPLLDQKEQTSVINFDALLSMAPVADDRDQIDESDKVMLVIEDDVNFAKILLKQCRDQGFKAVVTDHGESGYLMAQKYQPDAIVLDLNLPGMDGFKVLDKLKDNPDTRHIPVHIISALDSEADVYRRGAIGFLQKPVDKDKLIHVFNYVAEIIDKDVKDLLVIEDDVNVQKAIKKLIGNGDVKITVALSGEDAYQAIKTGKYDCMILDLGLPDMSGFELLTKLNSTRDLVIPPVIVYTGKDLTRYEHDRLREFSQSIIIKGVRSEERLLDETALFLHRVVGNLPQSKQSMIRNLYEKDAMFMGKCVLIIDDDMRNLFALSKILNDRGLKVFKAQNGLKGLDILTEEKNIDLVLMDIMMPEMDGYEATRAIRSNSDYVKLPIIALTAKAMKDDRDKCIAAGASDYLAKPIDIDRLLSMLRVWLYQ